MIDWPLVSLEEIAAPGRYSVVGGPFGSALGRKDYVDDGVPVIRGAQLGGPGWFSHEDLVYVSNDKADRHPGNLAYPGDVLVTQRGTVGQVGLIPLDAPFERYLLSQSQMKLTVDPARANARYVYYWLRSPEAQHAMLGSTISAGVPHINLATFKGMKLPLPSLLEQERVADVLGSIDDLIENNRRRVEVLEEMARAIYREWFVRFRYPGHEEVPLVDSPLGPIPDGWEVRRLDGVASLVRGRSYRKHELVDVGGRLFVNLKCMMRGGGFRRAGLKRYDGKFSEAQLVGHGDVVLAVTDLTQGREILARATLVPRLPEPGVISLDVARIVPDEPADRLWLFAVLRWSDFADRVKEFANGSTVLHLSPDHVVAGNVLWPPGDMRASLVSALGPTLGLVDELLDGSDRLALIRDLLLPKLATGQIDVSHLDLDALTEAAIA
jgi:type I restriction enzyme S subunit